MDGPPEKIRAPLVPRWLANLAAIGWRVLVTLALGLVLVAIAAILGTVTASIILALFTAAMFTPVVVRLRARGWSRTKAAAGASLVALLVVGVAVVLIVLAFVPTAAAIIPAMAAGVGRVSEALAQASVDPAVAAALQRIADDISTWIADGLRHIAGAVATMGTIAILGGILTFFLLQDGDRGWAWAVRATSGWRRAAIETSGEDALRRVGGYLRMTTVTAATDALTDLVYLLLLGVPYAGPLAVVVFLGGLIPYLGGLVTSALLLLVTLGSVGPPAAAALLALILVTNVVQARLLARAFAAPLVRVHPAVVLVALPVGVTLAGLPGMILAVPVLAAAAGAAGTLVAVLGIEPPGAPSAADAAPAGRSVPIWLDRLAQWSWRILAALGLVGAGIAAVVQVPLVALPLVVAAVLAATFAPLTGVLERRGWSHATSALVVTVTALSSITIIIVLTIASLVGPTQAMVGTGVTGSRTADSATSGQLAALVAFVDTYGSAIVATIGQVVTSLAFIVIVIVLGALLTYYFLRDGRRGWTFATRRMSPWRRAEVDAAASRAVGILGSYMLGTGAISAFGAATQFFIMTVLGLPYALPLAVLSFFGGYIPYIGSLITTGLAFLVTVAVGTPTDIAIMAVFTLVINVVQGSFVAPLVYGRAVNIHPAIVLVAIPAGNEIAGIIGMFLVVPVLGIVATTWRSVIRILDTEPDPASTGAQADAAGGDGSGSPPGDGSDPTASPGDGNAPAGGPLPGGPTTVPAT